MSSIPGLERSPGEGLGNPHQFSCLENPMDREAWKTIVHSICNGESGLALLSTKENSILKCETSVRKL